MRKQFFACLLLCMALLPLTALASEAGAFRYAEVATTKGTLNMRAAMKDNAEIIAKVPRGTIVRITEDQDEWMQILYKGDYGYVKTSFLNEVKELPYSFINKESGGEEIIAFKRALHKLDYLKSEDINQKFDLPMEQALIRIQMMNDVELTPNLVTPQLQALMEWGMVVKGKTGYVDMATDPDSGLTVAIFCWDTGGTLYEEDVAVKVQITHSAKATGGEPPYDITVRKSVSGGGPESGDVVTNPFSHIWGQDTERIYVYATVTDAAGNTATACAPFRYNLPERYVN